MFLPDKAVTRECHRSGTMKLLAGLAIAGMLFTRCDRSQSGQEMVTMIRCQELSLADSEAETYASIGRWQSGTFRYCRSVKLPEYEHEPQLKCDPALALLPEGLYTTTGKSSRCASSVVLSTT